MTRRRMDEAERCYLQRRMEQEMAAARLCAGTPAEYPHREMARLYGERLGLDRLVVAAAQPAPVIQAI